MDNPQYVVTPELRRLLREHPPSELAQLIAAEAGETDAQVIEHMARVLAALALIASISQEEESNGK